MKITSLNVVKFVLSNTLLVVQLVKIEVGAYELHATVTGRASAASTVTIAKVESRHEVGHVRLFPEAFLYAVVDANDQQADQKCERESVDNVA